MAAQFENEFAYEMSPLHERSWEADPFFGKAFKRIGRIAGGLAKRALPILKKLAPIAARVVAGAIPGVGAIAGPLAGKLVGALTQEQQEELEAILHEASSYEAGQMEGVYEAGGLGHESWEFNPEEEISGYSPEAHLYNPEEESYHPENLYNPEAQFNPEQYNPEEESEFQAFNMEDESGHPEAEAMFHPEAEAGLIHSEAAHQEAMLMEQIALEAAHAANEAEAEALAGSLIPMAMRGVRSAAPSIRRATPALTRATGRLVGALRRSPATRLLVPTVPTILRRTSAALNRAASTGTPVTPRLAVRTMADQTYRVMNNPAVCIQILIRSGRMRRVPRRRGY